MNLIDKSKGYLFSTHDLGQLISKQIEAISLEVEGLDANEFLNTAPADLKKYLAEKYRVEPLRLLRDAMDADMQEVKVDVRYDQNRWIRDTSRSALVPGERVDVYVPFEGNPELFYARANQFTLNPPRGKIEGGKLILRYETPSDAPRDVKALVEQCLSDIEDCIGWQRLLIDAQNNHLPQTAARIIEERRGRLLAQLNRANALGIPIRRREVLPQTYAIPTIRRKAAPTLPPADSRPFAPEPIWAMEHYEHALKVCQDMSLAMERSPDTYRSMDEEAIRQLFLLQLNGHFEGNATGETFNMHGKTDILLREGDRNVFIAECKFWKGPKAFGDAIDQLLSYSTWRDTKTAILVFNRGTNTSTVLAGVDAVVTGHANFKRPESWPHESGKRYVLHANGDQNRELILTVLLFHVPEAR